MIIEKQVCGVDFFLSRDKTSFTPCTRGGCTVSPEGRWITQVICWWKYRNTCVASVLPCTVLPRSETREYCYRGRCGEESLFCVGICSFTPPFLRHLARRRKSQLLSHQFELTSLETLKRKCFLSGIQISYWVTCFLLICLDKVLEKHVILFDHVLLV